jgi:hypothetical protein
VVTPAGYFRLILPGRELTRLGHEVHLAREIVFDQRAGLFVGILPGGDRVTDVDVLITKYAMAAWEQLAWSVAARRNGQVIVHDFDDWGGTRLVGSAAAMQLPAWRTIHTADLLITSNPYIAKQVVPLGVPTVVLPICIDRAAWESVPPEDVTDGPVLGWTGMISARMADLAILRPWLGQFMELHDLRIVHAGAMPGLDRSGAFACATGVDPARVTSRPVVHATEYPASGLMDGIDIGLVPMADSAFSLGKSALKGMEFSARGIPFVASPSDEYRALGAGRLAGTSLADQPASAWRAELERLLDPTARLMAACGTNTQWDIARHGTAWESALLQAVAGR